MGGLEIGYYGLTQAKADSDAWKRVKKNKEGPGFSGGDTSNTRKRSAGVTGLKRAKTALGYIGGKRYKYDEDSKPGRGRP